MPNEEKKQLTALQIMALTTLFRRVLLNPEAIGGLLSSSPNKTLVDAGISENKVGEVVEFLMYVKGKIEKAMEDGGDHWVGSN